MGHQPVWQLDSSAMVAPNTKSKTGVSESDIVQIRSEMKAFSFGREARKVDVGEIAYHGLGD